MIFFAIVFAVEGIGQARVGIILQPLSYFLKTNGWTPLQVTAYFAVLNFPWVIKPVFGLISDFVPLLGYRRTSYLMLASACAAAAYAGIALLNDPGEFALLFILTAYAMATASTLCGALLAENGKDSRQSGRFVGQQWLWFNIAIIAAVAPVAVIVATPLLLNEPKTRINRQEFASTAHGIIAALKSGKLYLVALFLFLYSFAPGFGTPLYYHMSDTLHFSQAYIGVLGSIASAGWIAGAVVHRWLLARLSSKALLYLSILLGTASAASFLLLTD